MPEHEPLAVGDEDAGRQRGRERVRVVAVGGERRAHAGGVAVRVGGDHDERITRRRVEAGEDELGGAAAVGADGQWVGQARSPAALVVVEQVGGLDEHERVAVRRVAQPAAHVGVRHAGVGEQLVGGVVGQCADLDDGAEVRTRVGVAAAGSDHREVFEHDVLRDVRQHEARRLVDPRDVVDDEQDRSVLAGLGEQVARGDGDGERLDRPPLVRHGQRTADGSGPSRWEGAHAIEEPVEEPGETGPRHLDLGLEPSDAHDLDGRRFGADPADDLVEHGRLADARRPDQRAGDAVPVNRAVDEGEELLDDLVAAAHRRVARPCGRRWGRRGWRHRSKSRLALVPVRRRERSVPPGTMRPGGPVSGVSPLPAVASHRCCGEVVEELWNGVMSEVRRANQTLGCQTELHVSDPPQHPLAATDHAAACWASSASTRARKAA